MKNLTKEQFLGIVRHTLTFVGGILLTRGLIEVSAVEEISGAILTLGGTLWSIFSKN
jgi:hypothetical protein